jgi:6-phosphogluconolactonase
VAAAKPVVRVAADAAALAAAAAEETVSALDEAARARGTAAIALSGGSTPNRLYRLLAEDPWRARLPWKRLHFFYGDERHVPPDDPQSNYRMTREALFARAPVPEGNVHRFAGEDPDADRAARAYEAGLAAHFTLAPGAFPRFDVVLLGLGPDAHTASLFPGSAALDETRRLAVANWVEKLAARRLTLTVPVFGAAALVLFLVAGDDKAEALRDVLEGPHDPRRLPAQLVRPEAGRLVWIADRAAAAKLRPEGRS